MLLLRRAGVGLSAGHATGIGPAPEQYWDWRNPNCLGAGRGPAGVLQSWLLGQYLLCNRYRSNPNLVLVNCIT